VAPGHGVKGFEARETNVYKKKKNKLRCGQSRRSQDSHRTLLLYRLLLLLLFKLTNPLTIFV
jgi:hypothetical protein